MISRCKSKIASVLASNNEHCNTVTDGSLDIWVNTAIAANEMYDILASNFNVKNIHHKTLMFTTH